MSMLRRARRCVCLHGTGLFLVLLVLALRSPVVALADAPGTRGPETSAVGGTGSPPTTSAAAWHDVRELPLPSLARGAAVGVPAAASASAPHQQEGGESGAIAWLGRQLNPGNWILDAGMGIFAGILKMFGGIVQKGVQSFVGPSVLPTGCDDAATNFVFCTPPSLTYDHPGVQTVWRVLSGIAAGIVTILFTVRLGRMIVEGPRSLAAEGKGLVLTFVCAMVFIQATRPICKLIIDFFNGLSHLLLAHASLAFPTQDVGALDFGAVVLFLVLWVIILILIVKSFTRLVQIIILIAVAPIAGALLMDRATSSRFRLWFEKLIELLLAQINLVIIFIVVAAILQPYQGQGMGDQFVAFLLAIVAMGMALSGKSMIGVAGAAMSGGGGMLSFLRYQVTGSALRGLTSGRRAGAPGGESRAGRQSGDQAERAHQQAAERGSHASGDPGRSAAAQRQATSPVARPTGAFRLSDAGNDFASQRASARYQAAESRHGSEGAASPDARREQARMRATLMRRQAGELRAQGDMAGADALARKATRHEQFGRGRDIARPARFTPPQRAQRRDVHRQALAEVSGMHALERDALTAQIGKDEQRLPVVQRELAMAGATGGDTAALSAEQQELDARLARNQARLAGIAPTDSGRPSRATRAAAAALANERLPQELRSRDYALRERAPAQGSPLIRRVMRAPTDGARQELAQAGAAAVQAAQTPAARRPSIDPARRKRGVRQTSGARSTQPTQDDASAQGQAHGRADDDAPPPSRVRSETIARLRARRRAEHHGQDDRPSTYARLDEDAS